MPATGHLKQPLLHTQAGSLGKPRTFDFLGFTHISGYDRRGKFMLQRLNRQDRMVRDSQDPDVRQVADYPASAPSNAAAFFLPICRKAAIAGNCDARGLVLPHSQL